MTQPLRIAINCRPFLRKDFTGIGRYTHDLVHTLLKIDEKNRYLWHVPIRLFDRRRKFPRPVSGQVTLKRDWRGLGVERMFQDVDIYHAPSPEEVNCRRAKVVVTVHDLIFKVLPVVHTDDAIQESEKKLSSSLERADRVICVSDTTRADLLKYYPVPPQKVERVYNGIDEGIFYRMGTADLDRARHTLEKRGIKDPYLLFVSTIEPRKNLKTLLKALALLKERGRFSGQLVVCGMRGWMTEDTEDVVEKLGLKACVIFTGHMAGADLRQFYNLARALIYPSFYEGFGLPIVEAFACGTPVITSHNSSCKEIAGPAALTVDPLDEDELAQAIHRILNDKACAQGLVQEGLMRAQRFTLTTCAREALQVYEHLGASLSCNK
ncbi:MAG: glycosyltransferase family 4 protein [Candidatus Omnitrophica bacterium]|nr:glycosyltransferase family 4 protein [Candidatus Omnitrophota bacterium]